MAAKFRSALREFENSALNKTQVNIHTAIIAILNFDITVCMQGTNKEDIKNPIDAVEFRPAGDPRSGHFISFLVTTHSIMCRAIINNCSVFYFNSIISTFYWLMYVMV